MGGKPVLLPRTANQTVPWIRISTCPITQGRNIDLHAPHHWTAIVTIKGHSQLMPAANDGIVTIDSMRNRRGVKFIEVGSNHHEVTQSRRSVDIITQ